MPYLQLTLHYHYPTSETSISDEDLSDWLISELGTIGFESFEQGEGMVKAFIPEQDYREETTRELLTAFPLEGFTCDFATEILPEVNWNEEWEKNYFQPVRIGHECLIRASFHQPEEGFAHTIVIDPRMAFGTGNHATTEQMVRAILPLDLHGREVLDMGCGTAVLAILAAQKGAHRVVAIDNDEWAYRNAIENCRLNNTPDIHVLHGGAEQIAACGTFDYIFANINRNILLRDMSHYVSALRSGGRLYLSGFYESDVPAIAQECRSQRMTSSLYSSRNEWAVVVAAREW